MSAISYGSGSNMASQVLGGAFAKDGVKEGDKIRYGTVDGTGTAFTKQLDGSLTAGSRVGTTSFMARFKANSETANNNRVTYAAIQDGLSSGNPQIAKAFGNNFWFSKMMGKPITKGAVVNFLDQKIKEEKAQASKPPTRSMFQYVKESLFGTAAQQQQNAAIARTNAANANIAKLKKALTNKQAERAEKKDEFFDNFIKRVDVTVKDAKTAVATSGGGPK